MKKIGEILKDFRKKRKLTGAMLAEIFDCSHQFIFKLESGQKILSAEKLEILKNMMTDEEYRELIQAVAIERLKDIPGQVEFLDKTMIENCKIPYFSDIQASAGYGIMNEEGESKEFIEVPANLKSDYNIAIKVSGDSMEPEFKTDDIVIINTCSTEIKYNKYFVVNYDDFVYLKKIIEKDGEIYLHSVNPYYPDIKVEDCEKLIIIGQVITVLRNY